MTSFLSKLRVLTLGSVNDLLDKAIDVNSPSAVREYTRELEDALDRMKSEAAVQAGQIRTFTRELTDLNNKIELGKRTIVQLNQTGHADLARIEATKVVTYQKQVTQKNIDLENQRTASTKLDASVNQLEVKYTAMVARVHELERLDMDTKSKEHAAAALSAAGRLVSGGSDISVDDVERRMRARNDVASEKFDRSMGDVQVTQDPQTTADVDALMNDLTQNQAAAATK